MTAFAIAAIILTTVGHLWFAYEVWEREGLIWALLLLLVPFPLLGLYIWFRAGFVSCYRKPALIYFAGYALALVTRVA